MPNGARDRDPEFRVDSASISSFNSTTPSEFTAAWDVTLLAINPNHNVNVHYDVVQVWLYYGRTKYSILILATSLLPPFVLNAGNQTRVSFKLATLRAYVGDDVVKNITGADGGSTTAFGLKVFARYRLRTEVKTVRGPWSDRYFCNEVKFGFPTNNPNMNSNSVTGMSRACKIDNSGKGLDPKNS